MLDPEEHGILDEFLAHGRAVRAERARAAAAGEAPDFISLVRRWGGVTLAYRKRMQDSPAYRLNHEEVTKALEEGIAFAENLDPVEAVPDDFGHVAAMAFTRPATPTAPASASSCRRARCSSPPARRPTSPTRRSIPARSSSTAGRSSSRASAR